MNGNDVKLKPCPFCGGEAGAMEHTEVIGQGACVKEYYVQCLECGAHGPRESTYYKPWWQCVEECAKKWNKRMS